MKLPLIVNLRGNSGSGKTFTTRRFMERCKNRTAIEPEGRIQGYSLTFETQKWVVLGSYENVCGDCDTIRSYAEIMERVTEFSGLGFNIWLEGLLMSDTYGSIGEFSKQFGNRWVYAYLLTPLDVCLARIQQRRDEAENEKPFNPKKTISRDATIRRSRLRVQDAGHRVVDLDWQRPLPELLKIVRREG